MSYRLNLDHAAFGQLVLNSPAMVAEMAERAARGKAFAESISPDAPPYGEGYIASFEVDSGTHGGINHDRAFGRVTNSSPHARYIEHGTENNEAHHVLGKTLDAL